MKELERLAAENARTAVMLDKMGRRREAAEKYREAVRLLTKVIQRTEDPIMREAYEKKLRRYRKRLEALAEPLSEGGEQANTHSKSEDDFIVSNPPSITWDDIIGLEEAKKAVRESIIYPTKRPDLFPLGWPRGILLYGPPGCGTTMLAAAVANEIEAVFMQVDASVIMSKWLGESERNIAKIFSLARRYESEGKPVIIFIDEADSLTASRINEVGGEARARNQLIKEMDGLLDKGRNTYIYVLAATNKPWLLDEPFIRRFQRRIFVGLPNYEARLNMFRHYTRMLDLADDVELEELARMTDGYSGADIHDICMEAQIKVVSEFFEKNVGGDRPRKITMDDFLDIIRKRKPSINLESMKRMLEWASRFGG